MKYNRTLGAAALVSMMAFSGIINATTKSTDLPVTLEITAACAISADAIDFGIVDSTFSTDINAQGTVIAYCPTAQLYNVGLLPSNTDTNGNGVMTILGGGNTTVRYKLYKDAARSQEWGNSVGGNTVSGTGNGANQPIIVYATANSADFNKAGGLYKDIVTVTLTY